MARRRDSFLVRGMNIIRTRITKKLERDADVAYREAIDYFYKEFHKHKITQELKNHSSPSAILNTLGNWERNGTLFGFMGFNSSYDPVSDLENFLRGQRGLRWELERNIIKNTRGILGNFRGPTPEDMEGANLKLQGWGDGRAWPVVIEDDGIENLSYFFAGVYGRSEEGFQEKYELNKGAKLDAIPYLSPILKKAEKKFDVRLRQLARTRSRTK